MPSAGHNVISEIGPPPEETKPDAPCVSVRARHRYQSPALEVTMAAPKINLPSPELQPPLAPYEHELNSNGECVKDCRACRWAKRTSDAPWNFMSPN